MLARGELSSDKRAPRGNFAPRDAGMEALRVDTAWQRAGVMQVLTNVTTAPKRVRNFTGPLLAWKLAVCALAVWLADIPSREWPRGQRRDEREGGAAYYIDYDMI